tara:strand:+ start:291 stop:545 length:255 start_codon:yes stop_codon:yes gene_type:complete
MESEVGKYGVWLSDGDMNIIEKSLEWLENSSYVFNETSKISAIKILRRDFQKIKADGVQIQKKVEIPDDYNENYNNEVKCKECD